MSESLKSVGAITMFVDDPNRSKEFYERVFGVSPVFEDDDAVAFEFENLIVNLLVERAAPELIEPTPVAGREAGSRFQLTIFVEDADAVVEQLRSAGVAIALYPLSAFRAMNKAALAVYETLRKTGTQKSLLPQMQTREELYEFLNYHSYEQKLDELFSRNRS